MEIWNLIAIIAALLLLAAVLAPAFGQAVLRKVKAGFYLLALVAIVCWTLLSGIVQVGMARLLRR